LRLALGGSRNFGVTPKSRRIPVARYADARVKTVIKLTYQLFTVFSQHPRDGSLLANLVFVSVRSKRTMHLNRNRGCLNQAAGMSPTQCNLIMVLGEMRI
jgi:hypothetical protein